MNAKLKHVLRLGQSVRFWKAVTVTSVTGSMILAFQNCSPTGPAEDSTSLASTGTGTSSTGSATQGTAGFYGTGSTGSSTGTGTTGSTTGSVSAASSGTFNPLYLGSDSLTYLSRQTTSTGSLQSDISFWVGGNGRFRFDGNGVVNAYGGYAFNHAGDAINAAAAQSYIATAQATGLFAFWEPQLPNDIGVFIRGQGLFRFNEAGHFYTIGDVAAGRTVKSQQGLQINADTNFAANYSRITADHATGFFRNWESQLPNDIGVFINGTGLFRFNEGGHFYTIGDLAAGKILKSQQGGVQLAADGNYSTNLNRITSESATGFFRNWESQLPNDIGVFLNGVGKFRFNEGGDFIALRNVYATNIQTSSDRRLKKNIQPLEGSLEKLSALQGVSFEWTKKGVEGEKSLGLIAQDVEKVYPELVKETDGYKSVAYFSLIGPIVEALKELNALITDNADEQAKLIAEQRLAIQKLEERLQKLEAQQAPAGAQLRAPASVSGQ